LIHRGFMVAVSGLALAASSCTSTPPARDTAIPKTVLWAWERPVDLRGLPADVGVAFYAQSIAVGRDFTVQRRRNPLLVDASTPLVAVTRIESTPQARATLEPAAIDRLATAITETASLPRVIGIQIDFDAVASERDTYRGLLRRVREKLPARTPLSMTALASWCAGDRWIRDLPVDESVAMLFQLGVDDTPYRQAATADDSGCTAIGLSLDELVDVRTKRRRVYIFNPRSWTKGSIQQASGAGADFSRH
jgi:hypothetical protein